MNSSDGPRGSTVTFHTKLPFTHQTFARTATDLLTMKQGSVYSNKWIICLLVNWWINQPVNQVTDHQPVQCLLSQTNHLFISQLIN